MPIEIVGEGIDWPAWVQGVGSVAAIFAAVAIAKWQQWNDTRNAQDAAVSLATAAVAAIETVARYAGVPTLTLRSASEIETDSFELTIVGLTGYMHQFPVDRLQNAKAVTAFIRIAGAATNAAALGKAVQGGGGDRAALAALYGSAVKRLDELKAALKR